MPFDPSTLICGLACFLFVAVAVIYLAWRMIVGTYRYLFEPPPPATRPSTERLESCVRCGKPHAVGQVRCSYCHLFLTGDLAVELRELEVVVRRIQALRAQGLLDPDVCEQLYKGVESRQETLLQGAPKPVTEEKVPFVLPAEAIVDEPRPVPTSTPPAPTKRPKLPRPVAAAANPAAPRPVAVPPPAPVEPVRRRSLAEWLGAFMEERNILWGELLGGLLIVGCSIALVISLWGTLKQVPYFPFAILAVVTGLLFGAGLYTLRRWKLETSSRGLLVISAMLVPLNFLVLAKLSEGNELGAWEYVIEAVAVAGLAALTYFAARVLAAPDLAPRRIPAAVLATVAVVGASASQLLIPRLLDGATSPLLALLLGMVPVAFHGLGLGGVFVALHPRGDLPRDQVRSFLGFLGVAVFSLAVALGFLIFWIGGTADVLPWLALPITLAGLPLVVSGTLLTRGAGFQPAIKRQAGSLPHETWLTGPIIGTVVSLIGTVVMLTALGLAWASPWMMVVVGSVNALSLSAVALAHRQPLAHVPALACLAVAVVALAHQIVGHSGESSSALAILAVVLAGTAELLLRRGRTVDGQFHAGAAGVGAGAAMSLVNLDGLANPGRAVVVFGVCAVVGLIANARWRQPLLTYAGSVVLLESCFFAFIWALPGWSIPRLALFGLLSQATLVLLAGGILRLRKPGEKVEEAFVVPFRTTAFWASTAGAVMLVLSVGWGWFTATALAALWLAALWLALAWWQNHPKLFAAFQVALTVAVGLGVSAWLAEQEWVAGQARGFLDPRSLHTYGLGLAGLGLLWVAARIGSRSNARAKALFNPHDWPAVDRVVAGALVLGLLALASWGVVPEVLRELTPVGRTPEVGHWPAVSVHVFGPGAWGVLAVLAVGLIAGLWDRTAWERILGLVLVSATVPILVAGQFREELASASAFRWGGAIGFVLGSVVVWCRDLLARLAKALRIPDAKEKRLGDWSRQLLVGVTVSPVLVLTLIVALIGFSGQTPSEPVAESFFARVGWLGSQITPLVLVTAGLAGFGVRERSPGYAFAAGLVANVSLVGGYALIVRTWTKAEVVRLFQLGSAGAAVWALLWLLSRPWIKAWRPGPDRPLAEPLMRLQLGIAVAALFGFLGSSLVLMTVSRARDWTVEAGSFLGWAALILTSAAVAFRVRRPVMVGLIGLAAVGLLACSVELLFPGWGYRGLLLGLALFLVAAAFARASSFLPPVGIVVLLLALKAAVIQQDHLWAAATLGLGSAAFAMTAGVRRREGWAFAAGVGVNLVVSFLVWHYYVSAPLAGWVVVLAQANLIAVGSVALVWLALRKRLYDKPDLTPDSGPLLGVQVLTALLGNAVLLAFPLVWLLADPAAALPAHLIAAGWPLGWLALLLAVAAALGYCRVAIPSLGVHAAGVGGLLLGVAAACAVKVIAPPTSWGAWASHHVLTLTWTFLGLVILAMSWGGAALPRTPAWRERIVAQIANLFPVGASRRWVEGLCVLAVGLALRGAWSDPTRPYLQCLTTLAVSVLLGALALWSRRPVYVYASGLLFTLVGFLVWQAWLSDGNAPGWVARGAGIVGSLVYLLVLCLGLSSLFWTAADLWLRQRTPPVDLRGQFLPFSHAAALLAVQLLAVVILSGLASDVTGEDVRTGGVLAWLALAATAAALALSLWDFEAKTWGMPTGPLYAVGLLAIGLVLHTAGLPPSRLLMPACLALSGYALVACAAGRGFANATRLWSRLSLPNRPTHWPPLWFALAQALVAAVIIGLSVGVSLTGVTVLERLAAPLAVVLVASAGVLLLGDHKEATRPLQYGTLALGVLATAQVGWATLDPAGPAPWLHRTAVLMITLSGGAILYGLVAPRVLARRADLWVEPVQRSGMVLGALAGVLVLVMLAQEFALYDRVVRRAPMHWPAVVAVALTLTALMAALIYLALNPKRDPLGVKADGRTSYVYASEVLLTLLLIHLRLTIPDIFPPKLGQYWPLTVMVIAFVGVGLGELFRARGLTVLATPLRRTGLFLPLLPLLAYLVRPLADWREQQDHAVAGLQPFLRFLELLPADYWVPALVWFLVGLLYLAIALRHRSRWLGLVAALAANFGLWVILGKHEDLGFLVHPQLWLIPLGLILIAAEFLHRNQIPASLSQGLRYGGVLLIYVASTADMFIAGLGKNILMPVTLAVMAVAGVLLGILLRVRAFLFLGAAFLFLVVFAQIWHAAVDQAHTWLWWVCGIVLGAAILTLFALFEKRRNDMLKMVEELKRWD